MLIIIPCGSAKLKHRAPAGQMYLGAYHRACRRYADSLASIYDQVMILSAKYGLLPLDEEIDPYELRMGQPGCVTTDQVRTQAEEHELLGEPVIALGGKDYTQVCKAIWSQCATPLSGIGGIGKQLKWLKEHS
jgi:hypothetical protein